MKITSHLYVFIFLAAISIPGKLISQSLSNIVTNQDYTDSSAVLKRKAKLFFSNGEFNKAIDLFKQSYDLDRKSNHSKANLAGENLVYLALSYFYNWEIDSSLHYLNKAKKIYLNNINHEPAKLAYFYFSAGKIYLSTGDQLEAESDLLMAEKLLKPLRGEKYKTQLVSVYLYLGYLYSSKGEPKKSIEYCQRSYQKIKTIPNNERFLINYYIRLSLTYSDIGNYSKSISLQKSAIKLCLNDSVHNIFKLGIIYNNIGLDYLSKGELNNALYSFKKSLDIFQSNKIKGIYLANLYNSYGELSEKKRNYFDALKWYQKAIKTLVPSFKSKDDLTNPKPDQITSELEVLSKLKSKSKCLNKIYGLTGDIKYLDAAIQTSFLTIKVIENLRNSFLTNESKLQISAHEDFMYKYALTLTTEAYKATGDPKYAHDAFMISEESKSSVLLSSLRELSARKLANIPDSLLYREKSLTRKIALLKSNIYEENQQENVDSLKVSNWEESLLEYQQEYEKLIHYYEKTFPKYYSLKYDNSVVSIEEFQKSIPNNTKVLEYALTDSLLVTFTITKDHFEITSLKIDSSFYNLVNDYLKEFRQFDFSKQYYTHFTEFCWNSNRLYNTLIKPFLGSNNRKNLLIIPDGILSFLPYETFISRMPKSIPKGYYRDLQYLLKDHAVSYAYSATFLDQVLSPKLSARKKGLLAFAPDYSTKEKIPLNQKFTTRQEKYRKDLFPIPGVEEEVKDISRLMKSKIYLGNNATETNFKKVASQYDILHLAMHTIIDNKNPMYSKLIFSLADDSLNDGLLNTQEIYGLKLNARLVVLSACSTGEGDYSKGEGVMSLARGFVYAGTPSLVMSMWEVEDKSTVALMKNFYSDLLKGENKAEALREAKLKFLREAKPENSHPFFWSAFVLMGNPEPLYSRYSFTTVFIVIISLLIGAFAFYYLYKRYRTRNSSFDS